MSKVVHENEGWTAPAQEPGGISDEALHQWRSTTAQLRETAARLGLSKSEVSRRSEVPQGTLSPWYDGKYTGDVARVTARVAKWLDALAETEQLQAALPAAPDWVETPTARRVHEALLYAQAMPSMAVITLGPGCGKTWTAERYVATRPSAHLVTMRPTTRTVHGMLQAIAQSLDVVERNPARLDAAIGDRLRRNGRHTLLIVDEAQNLSDQAVNQLRFFLDLYGCGIALLGNEELYTRLGGEKAVPAYAQIHRRVGMRVKQLQARPEDISALVEAWQLEDETAKRLARQIGTKPGALSQITQTLMLAGQIAAGSGRRIAAEDIRAAWRNRGGEAL